MRFLDVLQTFVVMHGRSDTRPCWSTEDGDGGNDDEITLSWADDDSSYLYFPLDAKITLRPDNPMQFEVADTDGYKHEFEAYSPVNLTTFDDPRAINLSTAKVEQSDPRRLEFKVGKFDVRVNHTDEGIAVDVWPWEDDASVAEEPLASCYAFDTEADEALEGPQS